MKVIEEKMLKAIETVENNTISLGNTTVSSYDGRFVIVRLFGNKIAEYDRLEDEMRIWHCNWTTSTTRSRLKAIAEWMGFGAFKVSFTDRYGRRFGDSKFDTVFVMKRYKNGVKTSQSVKGFVKGWF